MSEKLTTSVDPRGCPLCQQSNACVNLGSADAATSCWCSTPNIVFPHGLLARVPSELKRKSCICQSCAENYQREIEKG